MRLTRSASEYQCRFAWAFSCALSCLTHPLCRADGCGARVRHFEDVDFQTIAPRKRLEPQALCREGARPDITQAVHGPDTPRYIPAHPTLRRHAITIDLGSDVPLDGFTSSFAVPVKHDCDAISSSAKRDHDMDDPEGAPTVLNCCGIHDQERMDAMEMVLQTLCNNEWISAAAREATQDLDAQCQHFPDFAGRVEPSWGYL
jgi:hypothetical protein